MNIANIQEGGMRLKNQTLDLTSISGLDLTICVVMQLWLNRSMSIKTVIGNKFYDKPHLFYDPTTKKLELQTSSYNDGFFITTPSSFNSKRVMST